MVGNKGLPDEVLRFASIVPCSSDINAARGAKTTACFAIQVSHPPDHITSKSPVPRDSFASLIGGEKWEPNRRHLGRLVPGLMLSENVDLCLAQKLQCGALMGLRPTVDPEADKLVRAAGREDHEVL